jgi:hypothetical protein
MSQSQYMMTNHWEKSNHNKMNINQYNSPGDKRWHNWFFSRGSLACRQASPRCVLLHHVVRWLIGITHRASQKAPQEPTNDEKLNDTSNPLELEFGTSPGNHNNPSQITSWLGVDTISKSPHQSTIHQPSRWRQSPRVIRNLQSQQSPSATRMKHKCMNTRVSQIPLTKDYQ